MDKFLEHVGYGTPVVYAAAAYWLFSWLDANASTEAKAALARTMRLKDYKNEQVASALVEVFDRIYTYPLLRRRALFRSLAFTTIASAVYLFEMSAKQEFDGYSFDRLSSYVFYDWWTMIISLVWLLFNVITDYLSLFVIRPVLVRSGTKPAIGLALGAASGAAIVVGSLALRELTVDLFVYNVWSHLITGEPCYVGEIHLEACNGRELVAFHTVSNYLFLAAMLVFAWLPLFALGILTARLLTPLTWIVGRTQWFLKEGEEPLKAIGYVAAVIVFLGTVAGRAIFGG